MAKENLTQSQIDSMCLCPGCPSFVECGKNLFVFLAKANALSKKEAVCAQDVL